MNRCNRVTLEGNLTADPRFNTFQRKDKNGEDKEVRVCDFSLAINGGRDGRADEVCFVKCEAWDTGADALSLYKKGDRMHIEGNLKSKEWTDKKTNLPRKELIVRIEHFIPVRLKEDTEAENNGN